MKKLKLIGIAVLAVALAIIAVIAFVIGNGAINVVAPAGGSAVRVIVDGHDAGTVAAGGYRRFELAQGKHEVRLEPGPGGAVRFALEVKNPLFDQVLPLGDQCFALLDLTESFYDKEKNLDRHAARAGEVKEKHTGGGAFDLSIGAVLALGELPPSLKKGQHAEVLLQVPCAALAGADADIAAAALGHAVR